MDTHRNAVPVRSSIFAHCNPLKETYNDFAQEQIDKNLKVHRQALEDRDKETLNIDSK